MKNFLITLALASFFLSPPIRSEVQANLSGRKITLYEREWLPRSNNPVAILIVVHGLKDYLDRYRTFAEKLAEKNFLVAGFDLPGHGRSPTWTGAKGPDGYLESLEPLCDSLDNFIKSLGQRYPGKPIYLFGHSMGGTIVSRYMTRDNAQIVKGFVLSAPALELFTKQKVLVPALRLVDYFSPAAPFFIGLKPENFSRNPKTVSDLKGNDPLIYNRVHPVATALAIADATDKIQAHTNRIKVPFLILHSEADKVTNPMGSLNFYRAVNMDSDDKTLSSLKGDLRHAIFEDPTYGEGVQNYVVNWLLYRSAHIGF